MPNDDATLDRRRYLRDRAAELRRQFDEIEALFDSGAITRAEELALLDPLMVEVNAIALEMRRRLIAPANVPDLQ